MSVRSLLCVLLLVEAASGVVSGASSASAPGVLAGQAAGTPELLFDQGKRLFDGFQYDQAVPLFDRVIAALAAGGQVQKADLLAQAYELRGRAHFALGDSLGTEQDFSALLILKPSYKLGAGISPRVVAVFESVRRVTIGQLTLSMMPPGDVEIDGRIVAVQAEPQVMDMPAGEHQISVTRPGYRSVGQKVAVTAGQVTTLALTLERVSATLAVVSIPDSVEVLFDGSSRGKTARGGGSTDASAPLMLTDLQPGTHRLLLRRDCYKQVERTITIERPADLQIDAIPLIPAVATVRFQTSDPTATLFIDGTARGPVPVELRNVCEGAHVLEIRGPKGRFVDRRDWKTGDDVTLTAELRRAFPIVTVTAGSGATVEQLRANVERTLAAAKGVLVYVPGDADLKSALRDEAVPADWLAADSAASDAAAPRVPRDLRRELGRRLATKLDAQGVAAIYMGADPYTASLSLLAAGSAEPDVFVISTADTASRTRTIDALGAPLPPRVRPSIETSFVDVAGVKGAVVVRAAGAGAKAGLAVGDTVTSAAGGAVGSVADLQAKIAAAPGNAELALEARTPAGQTKRVSVTVELVPDTIPLRDPSIPYNRALLDLNDAVQAAATPVEKSAARLNLAIVDMRLGNWDDALTQLKDTPLLDGPGVAAGTVAYLTGLCLEALGRPAEAQAAFGKAAAASQARLWIDGPLIAPLAQQKLRPGR